MFCEWYGAKDDDRKLKKIGVKLEPIIHLAAIIPDFCLKEVIGS